MVSKSAITPRLVIIEGKDKGKVINLEHGTTVIGRSKGDVIIHDPRVSRSHVAIHYDEKTGVLSYTDLKSLNGSIVNGEQQETGDLVDGDRLQLGNTLFDCQIVALPTSPESESKPKGKNKSKPKLLEEHTASQEVEYSPFAKADTDPEKEKEPTFMEGTNPDVTRERHLPKWRRLYLKLPRRARTYAVVAASLLVLLSLGSLNLKNLFHFGIGERDLAAVKELESQGKLGEAVTKAESLQSSYPKNADIHVMLGDLYSRQGQLDGALKMYQAALELNPQLTVVHVKLARTHLTAGNLKEANAQNQQIERVIVEGPHLSEFFVEVANLYIDFPELQVPPTKMVIIGQAIQNKFAPKDASGVKLEAVGHIVAKVPSEAIKVLEKARQTFPQEQSIFLYLVLAKINSNDFVSAAVTVQEWIHLFPEAIKPLLIMAHWKFESREFEVALDYLKKIEELSEKQPNDGSLGDAFNLLGKTFLEKELNLDSKRAFTRSCELGFQDSCLQLSAEKSLAGEAPSSENGAPANKSESAPAKAPASEADGESATPPSP